jgi:hypothetical protein
MNAFTIFDPNKGDVPLATALAQTPVTGQTQNSPTIVGGTANGTTIGLSTPAAAAFTSTQIGTLSATNLGATGTFVCNGATPVVVADARITANSQIMITLKTAGGTVGAIPHVATITPTTGFTTVGTAVDTSTYNYAILA